MLRTIYLAGPMRGYPGFNFAAFDDAARTLRAVGYTVISPADEDRAKGFEGLGLTGDEDLADYGLSLREILVEDLSLVGLRADAVCALPGWYHSTGARLEVELARAIGLPVRTLTSLEDEARIAAREAAS